ncbi:hypothetical protein [Microseira wollei]|uniref:hypothetical protein n=1 Tax=Microseira wollei TaxID=467598 RepID=UPI001CFD00A9|nr:hypothetical protein [Microseira wollei]
MGRAIRPTPQNQKNSCGVGVPPALVFVNISPNSCSMRSPGNFREFWMRSPITADCKLV